MALALFAVLMSGGIIADEHFRPYELLPPRTPADRVLVLKSQRRVTLPSHSAHCQSGANDRTSALAAGVSPGEDIMLHGVRNGMVWLGEMHRRFDWNDGCIAVTDREIEEIWAAVPDGTPIEIRP